MEPEVRSRFWGFYGAFMAFTWHFRIWFGVLAIRTPVLKKPSLTKGSEYIGFGVVGLRVPTIGLRDSYFA